MNRKQQKAMGCWDKASAMIDRLDGSAKAAKLALVALNRAVCRMRRTGMMDEEQEQRYAKLQGLLTRGAKSDDTV